MRYMVSYKKTFVSGNLKGLTISQTMRCYDLDDANDWVNHCNSHVADPVQAYGGDDYTMHDPWIIDMEKYECPF